MRAIVFFCAALLAASATALVLPEFQADAEFSAFLEYTKDFNKSYTSVEEFVVRLANFKNTLTRIERMRVAHPSARFSINKFSDLSPAEFKARYLNYRPRGVDSNAAILVNDDEAPNDVVDWRTSGAVSDVKDQGQCGSCWAFSAAEEIESANFLAHKPDQIVELSPQQIVSCDSTDGGCNGGDTITAYAYVQSVGGIETEADYPYSSGGGDSGTCQFDQSKIVANIQNYTYATPPCTDSCDSQDEDTLASNLASVAPVSICVYAESWQDYSGGVFDGDCPHDYTSLDHCVQLVGYSKGQGDTDYWIVRNSWNTNWGDAGYIYLPIGTNACGVADEATIVFAQ